LQVMDRRAHDPPVVDAVVLEEALVLDGQERADDMGRDTVERNDDPPLGREVRDELTVSVVDPARLRRRIVTETLDVRTAFARTSRPEIDQTGQEEHGRGPEAE